MHTQAGKDELIKALDVIWEVSKCENNPTIMANIPNSVKEMRIALNETADMIIAREATLKAEIANQREWNKKLLEGASVKEWIKHKDIVKRVLELLENIMTLTIGNLCPNCPRYEQAIDEAIKTLKEWM